MKTYIPSYYNKFKCIADKCTHNCCIGWEIDIDTETLAKYTQLDKEFNSSLLSNTVQNGDITVFRLDESGRCANLDSDNLCKIISAHGEGALCDICRDHPRYRNYFDDREELGLGLSCEEAARIILSFPEKVTLEPMGKYSSSSSDEMRLAVKELLKERDALIKTIQDRSLCITERIEKVFGYLDTELSPADLGFWCDVLLGLERLDERWTEILKALKESEIKDINDIIISENELAAEQLLVYFILRHLKYPDAETDLTVYEPFTISDVFKFAVLSCRVIFAVANHLKDQFDNDFDALCEAARLYSSEIEYSTDNTCELLFEVSF